MSGRRLSLAITHPEFAQRLVDANVANVANEVHGGLICVSS